MQESFNAKKAKFLCKKEKSRLVHLKRNFTYEAYSKMCNKDLSVSSC